jgi:hypothetical protein
MVAPTTAAAVAVQSGNLDGVQSVELSAFKTLENALNAAITTVNAQLTAGASTTGQFGGEGNLSCQASSAGVGNAADTTDDVLFTYTLPANALDQAGRALTITACGKFAANGNNKTVKLWFGATTVISTGVVTDNATGWQLQAEVTKFGAANSNTQIAQGQQIHGTTHGGVNVPVTPTETENGPIVIKVTGASGTTGAANDVLGQFFQVNWMN